VCFQPPNTKLFATKSGQLFHCVGQPGQKSGEPTSRNVPGSQPPFQGQFFNAYWLQTLIVNSVGWSAFLNAENARGYPCVMVKRG
jgi:hypothetical protein